MSFEATINWGSAQKARRNLEKDIIVNKAKGFEAQSYIPRVPGYA